MGRRNATDLGAMAIEGGRIMREILFRGKRKDNGEWAVGYFVYAKSYFDDENWREADIIPHDTDRVYTGEYNVAYTCDIETVGQYTGLTDENGERIFEGDIVQAYDETYVNGFGEIKGKVVFNGGSFDIDAEDIGYIPLYSYSKENIEVIGNIHDNPELLK